MSELWIVTWRNNRIPESIIRAFYDKYGVPSPELTEVLIKDKVTIGLGKLSLPYTNPEITMHDYRMLLAKLGWPVASIAETQTDFAIETLKRGAGGLIFGVLSPGIALVGASVGLGIMIWRAM
jgi:hypothetical protein